MTYVILVASIFNQLHISYGTVRKLDLTGSVVLVKDDEIAKVPFANIIESIQGKMP